MLTPLVPADLAVLAAIVSSLKSQPLPDKLVMFGEVGLAGEIRPVQRGQERLKEAAKLGFTQVIVPADLNHLINHELDLSRFDARPNNDATGAAAYPFNTATKKIVFELLQ